MSEKPKGPALVIGSGAKGIAVIQALSGGQPMEPVDCAPVAKTPDITGPHGRAWLCDLAALRATLRRDDDATLAAWIVEARWAHPAWHSYALSLIHLRPLADGRATKIYLRNATHELWLSAMAPNAPRDALIAGAQRSGPHWLHPTNFAAQIVAENDAAAFERVEAAARRICDGTLHPDTDFIRHPHQWVELFGDNMLLNRAR